MMKAEPMIVDAHMHIWNHLHGRIAGQTPLRGLANGRVRIGDEEALGMPASFTDSLALAERFVAEMDAAGVDAGVMVQEEMDGEQNDYCLEVQQRFPGRFFCHALPDYWQLDAVADEARALFERGFRGLKVCGGHVLGKVDLDDAKLMPVWREMAERGHVLAADLAADAEQVAQMERVLAAYPALKVAVGHFGLPTRDGWPAQLRLARHEHVCIEGGGLVWLYRHEGYPFPGALEAIRQAADEVGMAKLMWGSDWPRTMVDFTYRQSLDFVRDSDALDDADKRAFLGGNAARLYDLPTPDVSRTPVKRVTEG